MNFNFDWRACLKAMAKAALPFLLGAVSGLVAGCSWSGSGIGWTLQ